LPESAANLKPLDDSLTSFEMVLPVDVSLAWLFEHELKPATDAHS